MIILNKLFAQIPKKKKKNHLPHTGLKWFWTVWVKCMEVSPGFSPWSWQWQVVALGMMSDGEDSHAQALVLYLMELHVTLGCTYRCQSPQKVVLSLRTRDKITHNSIINTVALQWISFRHSKTPLKTKDLKFDHHKRNKRTIDSNHAPICKHDSLQMIWITTPTTRFRMSLHKICLLC